MHENELNAITDTEERNRRIVELNTIEQCINVYKTGIVQRRVVETYNDGNDCNSPLYCSPTVHAVIFDSKDGSLNPLAVCFYFYA